MDRLAAYDKTKLIDLLGERLAFEREGVKLYDTVLSKIDAARGKGEVVLFRDELQSFRDQEYEHATWLEGCIEDLGGNKDEKTEMAKLVERESVGIEQVIREEEILTHAMHALLAAELVDNAGWELLIELADDADDRDARAEFRKRLHEEEEHLIFMRSAILAFARKDVLGYERRIGG